MFRLMEQTVVDHLAPFDIVMSTGLLHHLNDEQSVCMMRLAWSALRQGGRLITLDACYAKAQNAISGFLVSRDRGQHVRRDLAGYSSLAQSAFFKKTATVNHRAWIPYTHCIMECTK